MRTHTVLLLGLLLSALACRSSNHPTRPSPLGQTTRAQVMLDALETPGPIELTTVASADWAITRAGLINLDHERARAAGLEDGDEPIQIYFHVLVHPSHGAYIVDTGVETKQRTEPERALLRGLLGTFMNLDKLDVHAPLGAWLTQHQMKPAGVFLTHFHLDHVSGMRDVPRGTPIYMGPGELDERSVQNLFVAPVMNEALEGHDAIAEWQFGPDADDKFAGVIDVFGDRSVFAIHVPGHTPGSTAYLVRSTKGPVLLVGDASHTSWGWNHDVEPGDFSHDQEMSAKSLSRLRAIVRAHPAIEVRLGHQAHSAEATEPAKHVGPEARDLGHARPLGVELHPFVAPDEDAS